ncbi:MAG: nicotinate-nucleotide--dimethylbenzimidazole phosphoribosyltransferase, partial [Methyloceanibacter sp.]
VRYLVVNSEEGEPGIFKDRHLMEGVPHRILEGAIIAAYASDAHQAYIYINAEANLSAERMQRAVEQAYERGVLGKDILGSGFDLEVEIRRGAGGYVCGEETTLLNTMEGYRREPRLRPPFPTEAGLWAMPTVINNPETLASVPYIIANGAQAFAAIGGEDKGTKIISLSGLVRRPGVVEVPMGTTLRQIIYDIGGGTLGGRELAAILGAALAARHQSIPVLLDGFVCTAAVSPLAKLRAGALDHALAGHRSAEAGHRLLLEELGLPPLLDLSMRLGEGSGAAVAVLVLRAALARHTGMATFAEAHVSGKDT